MNKKLLIFLRLIVTVAVLFALFKFIPYKNLVEIYKNSHKGYIIFSFFIFVCCYITAVLRWKFLLSSLGIRISLREAVYSYFSGIFFNLFFPSFVAGDIFRGFSISYRYGEPAKVASSVLLDRFSGSIALILLAVSSYIFGRNIVGLKVIGIPLLVLSFAGGVAFLAIFNKSFFLFLMKIFKKNSLLREKLLSFHDQLYFFAKNPNIFIKSLFYSFPIQILTCLGFFISAKAFDVHLGLLCFLILVPIIMAIALIPITIAGAGTREASAIYFFSLVGIDKSVSLSISLVNLIFTISMGILGGIFYVAIYYRWLQCRAQN